MLSVEVFIGIVGFSLARVVCRFWCFGAPCLLAIEVDGFVGCNLLHSSVALLGDTVVHLLTIITTSIGLILNVSISFTNVKNVVIGTSS